MTDPAPTAVRPPSFALGEASSAFAEAVEGARDGEWATRLFDRDVTLWSTDPKVGAAIAERLGWLDAPEHFARQIPALEGFGDGVVDAGFTAAIVAGMGGSSLAPDVLHRTFGTQDGYLELRVLDSTDPAAVAAVLDDREPLSTLVVVASKSGTTTEPNAFLAAAWDRAHRALEAVDHHPYDTPGAVIAAITDPGRSLEAFAHHDRFRDVFLNPPDIGGRYSALTYVGLVPASLIGLDLDALLATALAMLGACREPDPAANPGVSLGLAIGTLAANGRDKLTFLADDEIASFGAWLEQLIAESTGKHGVGIVPVDLEPLGDADDYGADRVFVRLALAGSPDGGRDALADQLADAGHPVIRIDFGDPMDIGGEFVRWEVATAIAGAVLQIDPFDQPNVEEAKQLTRDVLARAERGEPLTTAAPPVRVDQDDLVPILAAHLDRRRPERLPRAPGLHRADPGARRGLRSHPGHVAQPDAQRHDRRLRPALPAFDRPAAQGRRPHRLVPPADRGPPAGSRDPGLAVYVRPAHRRPGGRRSRGAREPRPADPADPPRRRPRRRPGRPGARPRHRARHDLGGLIPMRIGFIGLGRMGANMVRRLVRDGHEVVVFNRTPEKTTEIVAEGKGAIASFSIAEQVGMLEKPRAVWVMVPAGDATEAQIEELLEHLEPGDTIIDGGNTNFHDDVRRHAALKDKGIQYVDAGTSGGIWGLELGYCLMVGGDTDAVKPLEPVFTTLAPDDGYLHVGGPGAGHYVKMVHNGIEYGLMQAYAEGFEIMHASDYELDLAGISELWMHGSVVRSWLLELAGRAFRANGPDLEHLKGWVADSGEGRWTVQEAIDKDVPAPVITLSLLTRFRSRQDDSYGARVLAALRNEFGGHAVKTE